MAVLTLSVFGSVCPKYNTKCDKGSWLWEPNHISKSFSFLPQKVCFLKVFY